MTALDLREMTFQNVVDQILKPNGVKVGGYPEDMFLEISEKEKETLLCNICFLVLKEARECTNKHQFCHTCIFAWTLTYGPNSQKCPVCRNPQQRYRENYETNKAIQEKRVCCLEDGCSYKSPIKFFLYHSHGKARFSNAHVDLESLRPERTSPTSLFFLPQIAAAGIGNRGQRISHMRSSLEQGRMMIHQMVFLLHLEMQLRQRSLVSMSNAQNASNRLARLDEVIALNEQLNEVGSILTSMMSEPLAGIGATSAHRVQDGERQSTARSGGGLFNNRDYNSHNTESDSDSDVSEASTVVSRVRPNHQNNLSDAARSSTSNRLNTSSNLTSTANLQTIQRIPTSSITTNRQSSEINHFSDETTSVTVSSSLNTVNPRRMLDTNTSGTNSTIHATTNSRPTEVQPATTTTNQRVLDREQVQNTITSEVNGGSGGNTRESNVTTAISDTRPTSALPPIEPIPSANDQPADIDLPPGSDTHSRTIRELYRSADNLNPNQIENVSVNPNIREASNTQNEDTQRSTMTVSRPNSVCRRVVGSSRVNREQMPNSRGSSSPAVSGINTRLLTSQTQCQLEPADDNISQSVEVSNATVTGGMESHVSTNQEGARGHGQNNATNAVPNTRIRATTGPANIETRHNQAVTSDSGASQNIRTFAPQKRFRRQGSRTSSNSNNTTKQNPNPNGNSSKPTTTRRDIVSNGRSQRPNQNTLGRRSTSNPSENNRSTASTSSDPPPNLTRDADNSNSNTSSRPHRTRKLSTDRSRGPSTAGQLIRARRRSEIMQELRNIQKGDDD